MKKWCIGISLFILSSFFVFLLIYILLPIPDMKQDTTEINELIHTIKRDWNTLDQHTTPVMLDYVVLDENEHILYQTKDGLSDTLMKAIEHRDMILLIEEDGRVLGNVIIYNTSNQALIDYKRTSVITFSVLLSMCAVLCLGVLLYCYFSFVSPFQKLKGVSEQIAGGNLDIPLTMDKKNVFGAFTESFDIMRSELKKARLAEAHANQSKRELVAKLSHDIKTPVASIKAASEVGYAVAEQKKIKESYQQITQKADQINTLISNLFTATLEELQELSVQPLDMKSEELKQMLSHADYLQYADLPEIPECLICVDRLRLQQVLDNVFFNSYKYANTKIEVEVFLEATQLKLCIEDHGGGVLEEEIVWLKEKYKRGQNAAGIDGAGLGLYISNYFMSEMKGDLQIKNGKYGLQVSILLPLSGTI